jgi:sRNA-binding protein
VDGLAKFLRDRLAHEEAHAKKDLWAAEKATPGKWRARYGVNLDHSWVETESTPVLRLDAAQHEADALLVARFQPETIKQRAAVKLAEVEAKRQVVDRYERAMENRRAHPDDLSSAGALLALHGAVKLLALPYADHPDYYDEWRP